jgi:hypothetical protein
MKYCFYIDKETNHKYDSFIDVKLDYPICVYDDEYIKIKIIDCLYLNNLYNVSGLLQNNIINLLITPHTYIEPTLMDILNDIYDISQPVIIYNPSTTLTYDTDNDIEFITGTNYKIHYKDDQILDGVDEFSNIFYGNTPTQLKFKEFDNYIIIEKLNENDTNYLRQVSYGIKKIITHTEEVTKRLVVKGSHDNITYTNIPIMTTDSELITFPNDNSQNYILEKLRIDLVNRINYKYYKFSINSSLDENSVDAQGYRLNMLKLYSWPEIPYTTGVQLTKNIVIPDGFYKATNYISKINELVASYNITFALDSISNKISITKNFVDNIKYPYTDAIGGISLNLDTANIRHNIGIISNTNILKPNIPLIADTNIDLINFKKIILTTNLDFQNKTHNEFIGGNTEETGIGNILFWINNDYPPYTCIKYVNNEDVSYRINNNQINNIRFDIYNEKRQKLPLDNMLIHFEIEKIRL